MTTLATFPSTGSNPGNLTVGPDGNLWGVEVSANKLFRHTLPSGPLDEYSASLPSASGLNSISQGPGSDTNLYFTMARAGKLGKISTGATPTITILPTVLTASQAPSGIVTGPDSHLWVTLAGGSAVIQVATDGTGTVAHGMPTTSSHPVGIAADAIGNLYVTDAAKLSKIHFVSNAFSSIADIPMPANGGTQSYFGIGWGAVATDANNDAWFSQWNTYSPTGIYGYVYEYAVTGTPVPAFSPATPTVQFGNQADNTYSGDYTSYLYNSGTNDFHVTGATLGGTGAASFHIVSDSCLGHAVTPSQACQFSVDFSPAAVQAYAATLTFTLTDASGGAIAALVQNLAGTGTAQAPMSQFPINATAFAGQIGRLNLTTHVISEFPLPTSDALPTSIVYDTANGLMYFTASGNEGAFIDSIDSTGVITERLDRNAFSAGRLLVGGDNNIWAEASGTLLTMSPAGTFLNPPFVPAAVGSGLATGPLVSGKPTIWYASGNQVSYVSTDGTLQSTFTEPISLGGIQGLTQGTGDTMYLTVGGSYGTGDANKVAKVVLSGSNITGFVDQSIRHEDSSPAGITVGPDSNLWFLELNPGVLGEETPF